MTTDSNAQSDRIAALKARRNAPVDQRRATIGKILATGLTSTTVFGITAALGWSATLASNEKPAEATGPEQLVLDLSTGRLIKYVNGVPVSSQQVTNPSAIADESASATIRPWRLAPASLGFALSSAATPIG